MAKIWNTGKPIVPIICNYTSWKTGKSAVAKHVGKKTLVQTKLQFVGNKDKTGMELNVKKPYRFKPGTVALREIRKQQKSVDTIIPKMAFARLIKEIMQGYNVNCRVTHTALLALQEAAEDKLIALFSDTQLATISRKKVTIKPSDMRMVNAMQNKQ